jgi:hypothetical protein
MNIVSRISPLHRTGRWQSSRANGVTESLTLEESVMTHVPARSLRPLPLRRPLAACLAAALGCAAAAPAEHLVRTTGALVVDNCNDSGAGSLREAFASALDQDEIDLTQLTCSTITLTSGALVNNQPGIVAVRGPFVPDGLPRGLTINGNHADSIFRKNSGSLALYSLAITAGRYHGVSGGGCIFTDGGLRLDDSVVSDCELSTSGISNAYGGAIFANGTVYIDRSAITGSTARSVAGNSGGGAIWTPDNITLSLASISGNTVSGDGSHYARGGGIFAGRFFTSTYSTISGNIADTGGGLFAVGGGGNRIAIDDSTISTNESRGFVAGILVAAPTLSLNIRSSTITGNRAAFGSGAGVYVAGTVQVDSSIIAGNSSNDGLDASDLHGPAGTNVAGSNDLIIASTLVVPPDTIQLDPKLGPLQNNGGITATHALLKGSPAIGSGNDLGIWTFDQRVRDANGVGFARVVGGSADIGAFEYGADELFADGFDPS